MADTGWLSGTVTTHDRDGKTNWLTWTLAQSQSDSYASNFHGKNDYTDWLRVAGFTTGIPFGSTITGFEVRLDRHANLAQIRDSSLRLVLNGTPSGVDKASATYWPTSDTDTYTVYGGPTDMWSSGYDFWDVVNIGFGWQISTHNWDQVAEETAYIDHMQVKVYYTPPAPTGYGHDVNEVPPANIGSVNEVPTANIESVNEVS